MASAIVPGTIFNRAVQRREDFSDAYRTSERQKFESAGQQIQQALAAPVNPYTQKQWTDDERKAAQSSLAHINFMIQNLYNPDFDPAKGAVGESILHKLTDKMKLTKAPDVAGQKAQSEQARGDVQQYTLPPGAAAMEAGRTSSQVAQQALKDRIDSIPKLFPNATPEEIGKMQQEVLQTSILGRRVPSWKLFKFPDGSTHYLDINHDEIPEGASPVSIAATSHVVKVGSTEDYMLQAYGPNPTPGQIKQGLAEIAQAKSGTTVGTRQVIHENGDGTATVYELTTTSGKRFPGASGATEPHGKSSPQPPAKTKPAGGVGSGANPSGRLIPGQKIPGRMPPQEEKELASLSQVTGPLNDLIQTIEDAKKQESGGVLDALSSKYEFGKYLAGIKPDQMRSDIIKMTAAVKILGAAPWTTIGRGKYLFEQIQQHLPSPGDSPGLAYDKAKFLHDKLIPEIENEINTRTMRTTEHPDPLGILEENQ